MSNAQEDYQDIVQMLNSISRRLNDLVIKQSATIDQLVARVSELEGGDDPPDPDPDADPDLEPVLEGQENGSG